MFLQSKFPHARDAHIKFFSRFHKYEITTDSQSKYTSVTTWNHSFFAKFNADEVIQSIFNSKKWGPDNKYWGMTAEQIKASWNQNRDKAASSGTSLHARIEAFMNQPCLQETVTHADLYNHYLQTNTTNTIEPIEWTYFLQFVQDNPTLRPYRTEWMIYDEDLKMAGSIDMVYLNDDGTLSIYDWKRAKDMVLETTWNKYSTHPLLSDVPDTNFWHYALQLNTYKTILERKYDQQVTHLCLVKLHPENQTNNYELYEVPCMKTKIQALFQERTT